MTHDASSAVGPDRDPLTDPLLRDVPEAEGHKILDDRYVLFDVLGRGGMGVVYRGHHLGLDLEVAIKCLDPSLVRHDAQLVVRFEREAKAAARIKDSHVVAVRDVARASGLHYISMDFVAGENARQRVHRKGPLAIGEALAIALGGARGLAAAHEAGLVHRDVKPDNILISTDGEVKLADLGLAKLSGDSDMTMTGVGMGTPRYMSPEQFEDAKQVGTRADVYSLGATLFFLLVGEDGIDGETPANVWRKVCDGEFPSARARRPDVPASLDAFIVRCIAKEPAHRPADGSALVAELLSVMESLGLPQHNPLDDELADAQAGPTLLNVALVSPPPQQTLLRIQASLAGGVQTPLPSGESAVPGQDAGLSAGVEAMETLAPAPPPRPMAPVDGPWFTRRPLQVCMLALVLLAAFGWFLVGDDGDTRTAPTTPAIAAGGEPLTDSQGTSSSASSGVTSEPSPEGRLDLEPRPALITGRVIDNSGAPKPGAMVEVFTFAGTEQLNRLKFSGLSTRTDASGRFVASGVPTDRPLLLIAHADGTAPVYLDCPAVSAGREHDLGDMQLTLGSALSGFVRDSAGQALPGALVEVFDERTIGGGPSGRRLIATTRAGSLGGYHVEHLADRALIVSASLAGHTRMTSAVAKPQKQGWQSLLAAKANSNDTGRHQNFTLWKADQALGGRVVSPDGTGIAGVEIRLTHQSSPWAKTFYSATTLTTAQGVFDFDGVPERPFDVSVSASDGYIEETVQLEASRTDHLITLQPALTLRGQLKATGEMPDTYRVTVEPILFSGARLCADGGERSRTYTSNDPPGSFAFDGLAPGGYNVRVEAPQYAAGEKANIVLTPATEFGEVSISLERGAELRGLVMMKGNPESPVSRGRVELRSVDWDPAMPLEQLIPTPPLEGLAVELGKDGRFHLQHIPAGEYVVTVISEAAPPLHIRHVAVMNEQVVDLGILGLSQGGSVSGRVMGADGEPAAGARVTLTCAGSHLSSVTTLVDGSFQSSQLPPGTYDIYAAPSGPFEALLWHATDTVLVKDGREVSNVVLSLGERDRSDP